MWVLKMSPNLQNELNYQEPKKEKSYTKIFQRKEERTIYIWYILCRFCIPFLPVEEEGIWVLCIELERLSNIRPTH
jgi:hypothetical protein